MRFIRQVAGSKPNGHYSAGVVAGDMLFISNQLPGLSHRNDAVPPYTASLQTTSILEKILEITKAAGGTVGSIVKVTVYVTSLDEWEEVDRAFGEFMGNHKPARSVVVVPKIKDGWLVSCEAICKLAIEESTQ